MDVGIPNCTLYVQNLNERVKLERLKEQLQEWFGKHGQLLEVHCKGRLSLKGQAFLVFASQADATQAMNALQGHRLWGKSMIIRYARFKSHLISRQDGTFEQEMRRIGEWREERSKRPRLTRRQQMAALTSNNTAVSVPAPMPVMGAAGEVLLPSRILYLQGLPPSLGETQLTQIFSRFPGFVECRPVPGKPEMAFVEYETEQQANQARQAMDRCELVPGHVTRVTFSRR